MNAGDSVTWLYEPRGGYGYVILVPATVVKKGGTRVQIEAVDREGRAVRRWVKPERLRERAP